MKRYALIALLILTAALFVYGGLGVLQAVALYGVGPGFSKERLVNNLVLWGSVSVLSCGLFGYLGWLLSKSRPNVRD